MCELKTLAFPDEDPNKVKFIYAGRMLQDAEFAKDINFKANPFIRVILFKP